MSNPRLFFLLWTMLVLVSCQVDGPPPSKNLAPPPSGAEVFREKCSKCHELDRALKKSGDDQSWLATIARMKNEHNADITNDEVQQLVAFHVSRQQREAEVFKEKCQQCHPGKQFVDKNLTPDQARSIIHQMQAKAGNVITEDEVELIISYHRRQHQLATESALRRSLGLGPVASGGNSGIVGIFIEKCSQCHEPERALTVYKDEKAWEATVKRMEGYSQGNISDSEAGQLVNFHVSEQRREVDTFQKTCTVCHTDERIVNRSMTAAEWLDTVRRMQQKAPGLITDEKVEVLARYYHRREYILASLFTANCRKCHSDQAGGAISRPDGIARLISLASEELASGFSQEDLNGFLAMHDSKEKQEMKVFEARCTACHTTGSSKRGERSMEEWASFIAAMQNQAADAQVEDSIYIRIDRHVSAQQ